MESDNENNKFSEEQDSFQQKRNEATSHSDEKQAISSEKSNSYKFVNIFDEPEYN